MEKNFHLSDQNFVLVQIESDLRYGPRKIGKEKRDNSRPPHWFDAIAINALTFLYVIHMKCFDIIKKNTEAYWDHINTYKPFFFICTNLSVNFTHFLWTLHFFWKIHTNFVLINTFCLSFSYFSVNRTERKKDHVHTRRATAISSDLLFIVDISNPKPVF